MYYFVVVLNFFKLRYSLFKIKNKVHSKSKIIWGNNKLVYYSLCSNFTWVYSRSNILLVKTTKTTFLVKHSTALNFLVKETSESLTLQNYFKISISKFCSSYKRHQNLNKFLVNQIMISIHYNLKVRVLIFNK